MGKNYSSNNLVIAAIAGAFGSDAVTVKSDLITAHYHFQNGVSLHVPLGSEVIERINNIVEEEGVVVHFE